MKIIQNLFEQEFQKHLDVNQVLTRLISKRLREYGVDLSELQEEQIRYKLEQEGSQSLKIELSDEQEAQLDPDNNIEGITINLGEDDLENYLNGIDNAMTELFIDIPSMIGPILLDGFKEIAPETLHLKSLEDQRYQLLTKELWSKPFDLLEMLLGVCLEAGADFNEEFRSQAVEESDYIFEALTRLHARGCQVGSEILILLKNGFAEGAYARWRTLHEITVVAQFLKQYGNDIAELYLKHRTISDYKDALDHQRHCVTLGWQPIPKDVIESLKEDFNLLVKQYGKSFSKRYGWAAQALQKDDPNFSEIEEKVGLAHARPFYVTANLNIHASAKSVMFRLGLPPNRDDILVAGPSYYGLAEPGQATAWTINLLTMTLLLHKVNLDSLALLGATELLVREIYEEFANSEIATMSSDTTG